MEYTSVMYITLTDVIWGLVLTVWVAFVVLFISRVIYKKTNSYVARKSIHILGGGVVAILMPYLFSSPLIPIILSYALTAYLLLHRRHRYLYWFQEKDNKGEVYFTISFGSILLVYWLIYKVWDPPTIYIALLPLLFMSIGDGITGIIRNYVYHKRIKGFWGSIGMLIFSTIIGYFLLSIPGLISGVIATVVERLKGLDDNISVPVITFIVLILLTRII